jgi:prepilin-type processing-associated H-X9-DG protein
MFYGIICRFNGFTQNIEIVGKKGSTMNTDDNSNSNDHTLKPKFNPLMIVAVIMGVASCCAFLAMLGNGMDLRILMSSSYMLMFLPGLLLGIVALVQNARSNGRLGGIDPLGFIFLWIVQLVLLSFLAPIFARSRDYQYPSGCLNHLKQISNATLMYADDYDDKLPPAANWSQLLYPYTKSRTVFRCPEAPVPKLNSYALNSKVERIKLKQIKSPGEVVMWFESNPGHDLAGGSELIPPLPRHKNGDNFCFADGHVKWWRRVDAARLKWDPAVDK